jgi:hypothetical protein
VKHFASPQFRRLYRQFPADVRDLADKNFQLLKADPKHPSLHFKKIDKLWSVRVGLHYRARSGQARWRRVVLDRLARRL